MTKIWKLIGALSEAHWRRATQPGVSTLQVLFEDPYRPESEEERAIWAELSAPQNYLALRRLVENRKASGRNEFAANLDEALLAEATNRWEQRTASEKNP